MRQSIRKGPSKICGRQSLKFEVIWFAITSYFLKVYFHNFTCIYIYYLYIYIYYIHIYIHVHIDILIKYKMLEKITKSLLLQVSWYYHHQVTDWCYIIENFYTQAEAVS